MSRILIISVSAGAGHLRASAAVEQALNETRPDIEVRNIDILDHASAAYRKAYGRTYLGLVRHIPTLWGLLYERADRQEAKTAAGKLRTLIDRLNTRPFMKFVREFRPDRILATHFLPAEVLAQQKRNKKLDAPVYVTLTDHDIHALWIYEEIDRYYAPDEEAAFVLARRGIAEDKIRVIGIPIDTVFARLPERAEVRAGLGFSDDVSVVLVASGGFGVGGLDETVRAALDSARGAALGVIAVCGRNKKLEEKTRAIEPPKNARLVAFGFTDKMHELMAAADLIVTKPGGLTSSESLAAGLPMIIVSPIPGQEEGNRDYLLEGGAAVVAKDVHALEYKLRLLLFEEPARLKRMRESAAALGRPRAAYDVAEELARGL